MHQIETTDPKQLIRQGKTILNSRAEQGKKESEIIFYGGDHGNGHGRRVSHGDYVSCKMQIMSYFLFDIFSNKILHIKYYLLTY